MRIKQLIVQETDNGCGEACMAMILGLPNASTARMILNRRPESDRGVYGDEFLYLLWAQGIPCFGFVLKCGRDQQSDAVMGWNELFLPSPEVIKRHLEDGIGLAVLPSKGDSSMDHCIAIDRGIVYDPEMVVEGRRTDFKEVLDTMTSVFLIGKQGFGHERA